MEFASLLEASNPPKGVLPNSVNTLGKYLTSLTGVTNKITKTRTKKGYLYTADFREDVDHGHYNGKPRKSHEKQREEAWKARQEEEQWEYDKILEMLRPEHREAVMKARVQRQQESHSNVYSYRDPNAPIVTSPLGTATPPYNVTTATTS